jgi:hypothetical protein
MHGPNLTIKLAGRPSPLSLPDPNGGASHQHAEDHEHEDEYKQG